MIEPDVEREVRPCGCVVVDCVVTRMCEQHEREQHAMDAMDRLRAEEHLRRTGRSLPSIRHEGD